jgi:catechol 1,2-dioxygenase
VIITTEQELMHAVAAAMNPIEDQRKREILTSLVKHLHAFISDVRLTEDEFRDALEILVRLGQLTTDRHNEAVLMAGSLGLSSLVCLVNNRDGLSEASASLLGPFWRLNSPLLENGASLLRSPTPGPSLVFTGRVRDRQGYGIEGAEVDVWHSSPAGLYENQDDSQAEMNLRGKFTTDESGKFNFETVKPAGYPIPAEENLVGDLLRLQKRHNYRPAHVHVLVFKPGFKTLITQIFMPGDPYLASDVQFGVRPALIGNLIAHEADDRASTWYSMDHAFVMDRGEARLPTAPIR